MKKICKNMLMLSIVIVAAACNSSSENKQAETAGSSSDNLTTTKSASFSYSLSYNGCETGEQKFDSKEKLCLGLQNNTLNKSCAVELRKDHFERECSGDFKPFNEKENIVENFLNNFEAKKVKSDGIFLDVFKVAPERADAKSSLAIFSCVENLNRDLLYLNGIILLKDSQITINRDTNFTTEDKKMTTVGLKPYVSYKCAAAEDSAAVRETKLSKDEYVERKLKVGDFLLEPIIVSSTSEDKDRVELTIVHCADDAIHALLSGVNGIGLIKGSKIVVKRDADYVFRDGSKFDGDQTLSVISCN